MKVSLADYLKDIGLTYAMIPIITTGFGYVAAYQNETIDRSEEPVGDHEGRSVEK